MKIVDGFIFYNELDLLTYRLNILNDVVDYVVIVESTHTHVGNPKPLFYQENKHLFESFASKIIHVVVDDFPHKAPNIDTSKSEQWINEQFQRNCISRGIAQIPLEDPDCVIISDLDEIPDPIALRNIKEGLISISFAKFSMDLYYYNLTSKFDWCWESAVIITSKHYNTLKIPCTQLRNYHCQHIIPRGGWHLSYFGNYLFIKNKIEQFGHVELNRSEVTTTENIEKSIKESSDVFHRGEKIKKVPLSENKYLPPQYEIYLSKFLG